MFITAAYMVWYVEKTWSLVVTLTQEDRLVDFFSGHLSSSILSRSTCANTLVVNNTPNGIVGQLGPIAALQLFSNPEHILKVQKNNKSLSAL
jgi:hypothetical protein